MLTKLPNGDQLLYIKYTIHGVPRQTTRAIKCKVFHLVPLFLLNMSGLVYLCFNLFSAIYSFNFILMKECLKERIVFVLFNILIFCITEWPDTYKAAKVSLCISTD